MELNESLAEVKQELRKVKLALEEETFAHSQSLAKLNQRDVAFQNLAAENTETILRADELQRALRDIRAACKSQAVSYEAEVYQLKDQLTTEQERLMIVHTESLRMRADRMFMEADLETCRKKLAMFENNQRWGASYRFEFACIFVLRTGEM